MITRVVPTLWVVNLSCDIRISAIGLSRLDFECTRGWPGVGIIWVKERAARLPDCQFWVIDGVVTRECCDPTEADTLETDKLNK